STHRRHDADPSLTLAPEVPERPVLDEDDGEPGELTPDEHHEPLDTPRPHVHPVLSEGAEERDEREEGALVGGEHTPLHQEPAREGPADPRAEPRGDDRDVDRVARAGSAEEACRGGEGQAGAEGTMTVRTTCRSEAPRKRAEWIRSASTLRAPWNVLKKTMKNTIVHASTIFARSPKPKIMVTSGTSAMRGSELKAMMYGSKTRASRSCRPSPSPAAKPVETPTTNPQSVDCTVERAIAQMDRRTSPEAREAKRLAISE